MSSWTLDEALREGRGTERPFRCHVHDDSEASASVNVTKGVWYCFACFASGTVDGKRVPSVADLQAMIEPEESARRYTETYLELFRTEPGAGYWAGRFPDWLVWHEDLGEDPFTGHATFPVRTDMGVLAGVGRRDPDPDAKPRYKYPPRWSAARSLHGTDKVPRSEVVTLVEGAADKASLTEVGIHTLGCYGAGLHKPQIEVLLKRAPKKVLLGFDMDDAGWKAAHRTAGLLRRYEIQVERIKWPKNDPADCTPTERRDAVEAVVGTAYVAEWNEQVATIKGRYQRSIDG